jgi:DNA polymerase-3 subunit gamma/tau
MYLSSIKPENKSEKVAVDVKNENLVMNTENEISSKTINQIKNIAQEEKTKPEAQTEIKAEDKISINSFEDLIDVCTNKKEIKLKYELEKNINLVKFEKNRIEISFNESLDKDFVKDISSQLFEWTGERWIITFSKLKGQMSVKEKQKNVKNILIDEVKNSEIFKSILDRFPDAELIDVNLKKDGVDDD